MGRACTGNCLNCGKCREFAILDHFAVGFQDFQPRDGFGIAVDIGTTSVVLALVDLSAGEIVSRHSFMNPQSKFGPDVISRINAANGGHLEIMRRLIAESVATGIDMLAQRGGAGRIKEIVVAGNTVMTYLLLGLPCESLGALPFKPAHELAEYYDFGGVFNTSTIQCPVRMMPWLAAFVGGDITAGLLHVMPQGSKRFMLIDLGTNGEIALSDKGWLRVPSAAAGPAFERSSRGGASGVMDDLASFVREGFVDETGLLRHDAPDTFTQEEIRDLQLAKSAVRSGLEILIESAGLDYDGLNVVYLAGGIGQAMNVDSAVAIGLLPTQLKEKTVAIGNASLGGAVRMLLSPRRALTDMKTLFTEIKEINLAEHVRFNHLFMEYMYF